MIKPIAQMPTEIEPIRYADNGKKCILYGGIYNIEGYGAVMPNLFNGGLNIKNNEVTIWPFIGAAFATDKYGGPLCSYTMAVNKRYFEGKWGNYFAIDDETFVVIPNGTSHRIFKANKDWKVLAKGNTTNGNYFGSNTVGVRLGSGDIVLIYTESSSDRSRLFCRFDSTLTQVHDFKISNNYSVGTLIDATDTYILAASCGLNHYGRHILYKYDPGSQTVTTLIDFTGAGKYATSIPSQMLGTNSSGFYFVIQPKNTNSLYYRVVNVNKDSMTATREDWTADYGDKNESDVIYLNKSDRRQGIDCFVTKDNDGNHYLHVVFLSRYDFNADTPYYKIVSYRIDADNKKLVYVDHYDFGQVIHSYIPLTSSFENIAVLGVSSFFFMRFDHENQKWVVHSQAFRAKQAYIDSKGRLWTVDTSNNLRPMLRTVPDSVTIKLANPYVRYEGEPIDNTVLIDVTNYEGERIAVEGDLIILTDNLEFSDGSKVKHITTSTTDVTQVPIKVIGGGAYNIDFRITSLAGG